VSMTLDIHERILRSKRVPVVIGVDRYLVPIAFATHVIDDLFGRKVLRCIKVNRIGHEANA